MEHEPIATPRGILRLAANLRHQGRVRVRAYIHGDHPAIFNPGDALLVVQTEAVDIELLLSGAEIAPLADALLACVEMRERNDDWLTAPVTRDVAA
jgi:hypothetical protein